MNKSIDTDKNINEIVNIFLKSFNAMDIIDELKKQTIQYKTILKAEQTARAILENNIKKLLNVEKAFIYFTENGIVSISNGSYYFDEWTWEIHLERFIEQCTVQGIKITQEKLEFLHKIFF